MRRQSNTELYRILKKSVLVPNSKDPNDIFFRAVIVPMKKRIDDNRKRKLRC